mmetsp:Transcript_65083/g.72688  ORF Transcript_65083/g.72688 Transcript_65083/m.72688 type:complete len:355 (-) Transcript_65083:54-1118(-)
MTTSNEGNMRVLFERKLLNFWIAVLPFSWIHRWTSHKLSRPGNFEKIATLVMDGIKFGEGPRIHQNHLYLSAMHENCVYKIDIETNKTVKRIDFKDKVSGLGWLPNGKMLVVVMTQRKILCYDESTEECEEYADISKVTQYRANDMVVDEVGNAYVGNFGFDISSPFQSSCTTTLVRVDTNRQVHVESTGMFFPNGCVITPDGKTLLVNETMAGNITAFDRNVETGGLSNRRIWAAVGAPVDGCCLDAEGCIWAAVPQVGAFQTSGCVARVNPQGEIVETLGFDHNGLQGCAIACNLATLSNGQHVLYVLEADTIDEHLIEAKYRLKNARVKVISVEVGPARRPDNPHYNAGYC